MNIELKENRQNRLSLSIFFVVGGNSIMCFYAVFHTDFAILIIGAIMNGFGVYIVAFTPRLWGRFALFEKPKTEKVE